MSYRMPAEWEKHEATWLSWPHNKEHWPGKFEPIPWVYTKIIAALAESEKVCLYVKDQKTEEEARDYLMKAKLSSELLKNVHIFHIPTEGSWSRDHAPIFVRNEKDELIITDWIFNGWGNKWASPQDDVVPQHIGKILQLPVIEPGMVLEGGSIDVNGKGSLITTEQCLLHPNRNPQLSREQIEKNLDTYLGASHIIWLKGEIVGDDTDGHIDDIARFVDEKTIVCALEKDEKSENFKVLQKNFRLLEEAKDQNGKPFNIVAIPMPEPIVHENEILPASYANFYIANTSVLVPTFRCAQDEEALKIFTKLFPTRKIVGIDCVDLVWGLGTIHCSTQQQPVKILLHPNS